MFVFDFAVRLANGAVDLDDYFTWLDNDGTGGANDGDANHDGVTDTNDPDLMQNQFELELD